MQSRWTARMKDGPVARVAHARTLALLLAVLAGCAQIPGAEKFQFATNADRDDAVMVADADDVADVVGEILGDDVDAADDADVAKDVGVDADATGSDIVDAADAVPGTDVVDADVGTDVAVDAATDVDVGVDALTDTDVTDDVGDGQGDADSSVDVDISVDVDAGPICATLGACSDDNACTTDSCIDGTGCVHTPITCADNDACTSDSCDPTTGCVFAPIDVPVKCTDGNPCTTDSCQPLTGCVHSSGDCNDNDACTTDTCDQTTGCGHVAISCDDGKPCTSDSCNIATGCTQTVLDGPTCDDGDACTIGDACAAGTCVGALKSCADTDTCTVDSCDPAVGCAHVVDQNAKCDDGKACTEGDSCATGTCAGAPRLWQTTIAADQEVLAIATRPGGGFVTVTRNNKQLAVRAWSSSGVEQWKNLLSISPARAGATVNAAGDVAVVAATGYDGFVVLYDATGATIDTATVPSGSAGELNSVVAEPAGGFHAYGWIQGQATDPADVWIVDIDSNGKVTKQVSVGGPGLDTVFASTTLSDGNFAIAGMASSSSVSSPFVMKAMAGTTPDKIQSVWQFSYPSPGTGRFQTVVAAADGGLLAVGEVDAAGDGAYAALTVRLDGAGKLLWSHLDSPKSTKASGTGAVALPGNRWLTNSASGNAYKTRVHDADGRVLWQHIATQGGVVRSLAMDADTIVSAWAVLGVVHIQRADRWGNVDCAVSGDCLTKPAEGCGDNNVCTSDECVQGLCAHPTNFTGTPCEDGEACHGDAVCDAGTCGAGADLLGLTTDNTLSEGRQIVALPDGSWSVVAALSSMGVAVVNYSSTGKQRWSKNYPTIYSARIFADSSGNTFVVSYDSMVTAIAIARIGIDGTVTGNWSVTMKGAAFIVAGAVQTPAGEYLILGSDAMQGYLVTIGTDGSVHNTQMLNNAPSPSAIAIAADGNVFITGMSWSNGFSKPFVGKYTTGGQQLWRYDHTPPAGSGWVNFTHPVALPDGGCAVVLPASTASILRFAADGTLKKTQPLVMSQTGGGSFPVDVAALSDGGLIVTAAMFPYTAWHVDAQGNVAQSMTFDVAPGPSSAISVAVSAQDHVAFTSAYQKPSGGPTVLGFWRTDAFLNETCKASGACASTPIKTCNTGASCYLDGCKAGDCSHVERPNDSTCEDGVACTFMDTCAKGTCVAGADLLGVQSSILTKGTGVAVYGQDSYLVAGSNLGVGVVRFDPVGGVAWQRQLTTVTGVTTRPLVDASGDVLVGGQDAYSKKAWIGRFSKDNSIPPVSASITGTGAGPWSLVQILSRTNGFLAVGNSDDNGGDFWFAPLGFDLTSDGAPYSFGTTAGSAQNVDTLRAASQGTDGHVVVIGSVTVPGQGLYATHIRKVDPYSATTEWQWTSGYEAVAAAELDVAMLSDGGCIAVGATAKATWLARFGSNGAPQWSRQLTDSAKFSANTYGTGVAVLTDGSYAVTGYSYASNSGHLWHADTFGNTLGDWPLSLTHASRVVQANTFGLLIAGDLAGASALLHTDLFGNGSCATSGSCVDATPLTCDDMNPCTLDLCAGSCKHTNVTDGLACQDGDPCTVVESCTGGVCTNGSPALWSVPDPDKNYIVGLGVGGGGIITAGTGNTNFGLRLLDWAGIEMSSFDASGAFPGGGHLQVNADGGFVVGGHTVSGGTNNAWVGKFTPSQGKVWTVSNMSAGTNSTVEAVIARGNGGYWAVGSTLESGGVSKCAINPIDEIDGTFGKTITPFDATVESTCANARTNTSGAFVVVGTGLDFGGKQVGYIAKMAVDGTMIWTATYSTSLGAAQFHDVALTADGGAIAVGEVTGKYKNILLVRYDSAGVKKWVRTYDFGDYDEGHAISLRSDGAIDLAGQCNSEVCLLHLSPNGAQQWKQTFGEGRALQLQASGYNGLFLAGESKTNVVIHVDWSGNATCQDSGSCISNSESQCAASDDCMSARCTVGKCNTAFAANGSLCEDGDPCTGGDTCIGGKCSAGTGPTCGNGVCDTMCNETVSTCMSDCM